MASEKILSNIRFVAPAKDIQSVGQNSQSGMGEKMLTITPECVFLQFQQSENSIIAES